MAVSLFQAILNALSKTVAVTDDIPVAAANLIEVQVKSSNPAEDSVLLPSLRKGKPMSEGEFYRNAAGASLVPKTLIALALGAGTAGLSLVGMSGVLTLGLVPLSLWICGKSAEKEDGDDQTTNSGEYKPSWTEKLIKRTPGVRKFLKRLPPGHRRILGKTIEMDVMLEIEMMTLAAIALGASGLATAGIVGFCATVAIVPVVAVAATAIVWGTAFGIRKFTSRIAKNQKDIASGARQEKRFDKLLNFVDKTIEPTLGIVGKVALMSIGGALVINEAIIPLAQMAIPHLSASLVPAMQGVLHAFNALPGLARMALYAPLGYGIGRSIYNPYIAPAMGALGRAVGKVARGFKNSMRFKKKVNPQVEAGPARPVEPALTGKIRSLELRPAFKGNEKIMFPLQNAKELQAEQLSGPTAPKITPG